MKFHAERKKKNMVNITKKTRGHPGCNKRPSHGMEGSQGAELCAEHRKEGTINGKMENCDSPCSLVSI